MAEGEDLEKTEEPTSRRIEEAMKKGQIPFSREVTSFLFFVLLALNIIWLAPGYSKDAMFFLSKFITSPHDIIVDEKNFPTFLFEILKGAAAIFFLPILLTVILAIFSSVIQNGIVFSNEPMMPKLEKISLLKGLGRLFSLRSFMEFIKGLLKIIIVGYAAYLVVKGEINKIINLPEFEMGALLSIMSSVSFKVVLAACIIMFFIALVDFLYQKFEYLKSLRMSKQELKEEYKQTEGDPQIKSKLKQIRQQRARKRMMQQVPKADVIIRNPTHYAIALRYEEAKNDAPVVVAIGADLIALTIIKLAEENKIPVITNRMLAKALYETAELDEEIPLEHYKTVAEIIAYVYKLKGKKLGAAA